MPLASAAARAGRALASAESALVSASTSKDISRSQASVMRNLLRYEGQVIPHIVEVVDITLLCHSSLVSGIPLCTRD